MYGSHVDALMVDIRHGGDSANFTTVWTVQPPPNSAEEVHDTWKNHGHVSLAAYKGDLQIRIRGRRGEGIRV